MQAKQNLCLLGVCVKLDVQAYGLSKHSCFHIRFVCHSLKSAMVMLQASQLCFAVFLASLPSTQAEGNSFPLFISRHNNNSLGYESGFINNTRCGWDCTVIDSDFPKHWKTVSVNDRLIKVVVEYEKKVTEQCARQTSRDSSGNGTDYFNVWLPANYKDFNFDHAVQRVLDLVTSSNTEERVNVKTACAFRPLRTSSAEPVNSILNRYFLSQSVRSHLADHGFNVKRSNDCNAEMSNLEPCIIIRNSTVNREWESVWFDCGLLVFGVFSTALVYYSPAYICFFYPTVITEHGLRQIVLGGASPVGFRSLVGNYFHSGCGHGARMLFLRLVLLPLPFLCPAIAFVQLLHWQDIKLPFSVFYQPYLTVFLVCYVLQSILSSYSKGTRRTKPCCFCRFVKPNFICVSESRRRVLNHMRIQPMIFIKCWWYFRKCLVHYFNMCRVILPARWDMSPRWFFRVAGFLVLLFAIPAVTITLFAAMLVVDVFSILFTAPLFVLLRHNMASSDDDTLLNRWPFRIFVRIPRDLAFIGVILVLVCAASGFEFFIAVVFVLLSSEQSLPFVVLSVLVCYYLWSSYSSFTNRYHEFSLILFKCYQEHLPDQVSKEVATATTADPAQDAECIPNAENEANVIKIPKELFDIACEELMPIRESFCILVLKVVFILSFVFLVFAVIMTFHIGATPLIRALVTFLTGLLPKIFAINTDGARKRNLEAMVIEEPALRIVLRYLNRTASSDPEQDSSGTHTEEVIIVDEN